MRSVERDTPPSSINGDEIAGMEEEGIIYMDELEEYSLNDENMEELATQDEEDEDNMEPPEDHAALVFKKHVGSVFWCDIHPTGIVAVTGGEDDKAYVWSVETGEVVMECIGHKDSVVYVGFSSDGTFLATADMNGLIKVWKCNLEDKEPWQVVFEYQADDLTWGLWHFAAKVLICGTTSGNIYIFKIPSGETKVLQGDNSQVECGKLFPDGTRLAAGYENGSVKVWDIKSEKVIYQIPPGVHPVRVISIDTHPENNLMASISTDGKVILSTPLNGKIVGELEAENDLEAVAFAQDPELGYFALGTINGDVSIWDVARQMVRHHCMKSEDVPFMGVVKLIWVKSHLIIGCLDGSIRVYEGRSGKEILTLTGHRSEILDLCYNSEKNLILTTSEDGTARIFKYEINKDKE